MGTRTIVDDSKMITDSITEVTRGLHSGPRAHRTNKTAPAVERNNRRRRNLALTQLLNFNFDEGDIVATLTYSGNETRETCHLWDDLTRFCSSLKKLLPDKGESMRMLAAVGLGEDNGRPHAHIIVAAEDLKVDMVKKAWPHGWVDWHPAYLKTVRLRRWQLI